MLPLAELEARQLPLIQCCVIPKMLSPHDNVRRASAEAELKIDAQILSSRCFVDFLFVLVSSWIEFLIQFLDFLYVTDGHIFVQAYQKT